MSKCRSSLPPRSGPCLVQQPRGAELLRDIIVENIRRAQMRCDARHVRQLLHLLHHFLASPPEARPQVLRWSRML